MTNRVGQQFGHYRLTRLLGVGSFSEVYLGEHVHLGQQKAIKVLDASLTSEELGPFRRDIGPIASLRHPNIVGLVDLDAEEDIPFLVMDYVPNGTLRQRHPKGVQLPPQTILPYIRQTVEALQYIHDKKLLHLDVKPENLLLGSNNEVLLGDFGIVDMLLGSSSARPETVVGTLAYMAPEQIQLHPCPASDQYALGVVIYEWLSGMTPFSGTRAEVAAQQLHEPPPSLREKVPAISFAIERVLLIALAKHSQDRFPSMRAFASAFEGVCKETSVSLSIQRPVPVTPAIQPTKVVRPPGLQPMSLIPSTSTPLHARRVKPLDATSKSSPRLTHRWPFVRIGGWLSIVGGMIAAVAFPLPWFFVLPFAQSNCFSQQACPSEEISALRLAMDSLASGNLVVSFLVCLTFAAALAVVGFGALILVRKRRLSFQVVGWHMASAIVGLLDTCAMTGVILFTFGSYGGNRFLAGFFLALIGFCLALGGSILTNWAMRPPARLKRLYRQIS